MIPKLQVLSFDCFCCHLAIIFADKITQLKNLASEKKVCSAELRAMMIRQIFPLSVWQINRCHDTMPFLEPEIISIVRKPAGHGCESEAGPGISVEARFGAAEFYLSDSDQRHSSCCSGMRCGRNRQKHPSVGW